MTPYFRSEFVLPGCDEDEQIVLPRQSPLGTYEGLEYQPMGGWPANFLCLRHGRVSLYWPDTVHLTQIGVLAPDQPQPSLWEIDFQHDQENCGRLHTIYTTCSIAYSEADILNQIARTKSAFLCGEHEVVLKNERLILRKVC
jgi:hypothetical protein